jgi:putative tricarboxylic transport membrane protein
MKKADQFIGIFVLLFSLLVIEESWRLSEPVMAGRISYEPGAEFLPLWAGVLMAILSLLLVISATLRPADPAQKAVFPRGSALAAVVQLMASLAAYIFLLDVLGYLTGTFLLLLCLMRAVMRATWKSALLVSLVASVSLYTIFQVLLNVNLPKNMFGF